MRASQKVIALLWMFIVIAVTAVPPWTVRETAHYSGGANDDWGTENKFRWFFASPLWETYAKEGEPSVLMFSGRLRFDLLALEIFMASVIATGLLLVTKRRR